MRKMTRIRKRPLSLHPQRHFLPPSVSPFVHFLPTPENSHLPTVATLKVHLWTLVLKILFCTWWEIKREVKNVFVCGKKAQGWLKTGFQTDRKGDRSHPSSQPEKKLLIIFMCSDENWPMIISEHRKVLHISLQLGNPSIHPTWCCSAYIRRWIISCCTELRNVNFFTQTKILVKNFTPKTRNSRLICFRNKTRKSWSIQVVVGLVCYVCYPIGYLHRIWVECKCALVEITPLKYII